MTICSRCHGDSLIHKRDPRTSQSIIKLMRFFFGHFQSTCSIKTVKAIHLTVFCNYFLEIHWQLLLMNLFLWNYIYIIVKLSSKRHNLIGVRVPRREKTSYSSNPNNIVFYQFNRLKTSTNPYNAGDWKCIISSVDTPSHLFIMIIQPL